MAYNEAQQKIIEKSTGILLVLAGPGTGKTHMLIAKILHLIQGGISPQNILALTFSRRAAQEMTDRMSEISPQAAEQVTISTFHALCLDLVRRHAFRLGLGIYPQLISGGQERLLFRQLS